MFIINKMLIPTFHVPQINPEVRYTNAAKALYLTKHTPPSWNHCLNP